MLIAIDTPELKMEIINWNEITLKLFEIYSDSILNNYNQTEEKKIQKDNEKKITSRFLRAPNNTSLFLHWIENKDEFTIDEFLKKYSYVSKEQTEKIIAHQIRERKLIQLTNNKFRKTNIREVKR